MFSTDSNYQIFLLVSVGSIKALRSLFHYFILVTDLVCDKSAITIIIVIVIVDSGL